MFSRIGISSALAGPRLTKLVQQACAETANDNLSGVETVESNDVDGTNSSHVSFGALMAGAAAKRREREMLFTNVGPCRRALCARKDLGMRKRLRRLTGKVSKVSESFMYTIIYVRFMYYNHHYRTCYYSYMSNAAV